MSCKKQGQAPGLNGASVHHKLQLFDHKEKSVLLHIYSIGAKYLVEVFKYPGTRNCIPPDLDKRYGMQQMIRLYGLVQPYSIVWITTTQSGVTKDGKKKSTSKCYCTMCEYIMQNHPSMNNHVQMHLHLSRLCTIDGCFTIDHCCTNMWNYSTNEHSITAGQPVVKIKGRCKK